MKIKVGVFETTRKRGTIRVDAYTILYNPAWEGCCEHEVEVEHRRDAKDAAKAEHLKNCISVRPVGDG
jgi:hypothetical protein